MTAPTGDDTGQLSKAEKVELLARIDRAAKKQLETTQILRRAEQLIQEGELEQAQDLVDKVGVVAPRAARLERVRALLEKRLAREERLLRLKEMEQMVEGYIQKGQRPLAELALETLLDFDPEHPKQKEYREWIGILGEEAEQDRRAREALAAGRQALTQEDFKAARKRLVELRRHDRSDEMAPAFEEVQDRIG